MSIHNQLRVLAISLVLVGCYFLTKKDITEAQTNTGIVYVTTAPSGAVSCRAPLRLYVPSGALYSPQGMTTCTWGVVGPGASGPPSGAAGGDLTGTYPNPVVAKINGTAFSGTNGNLVKFGASNTPGDSGLAVTSVIKLVATGAKALATGAISSAVCTTAQTDTATGTLTTDTIIATFNADPSGVTGYVPLTTGSLYIYVYPTTDTVNFKVCNNSSSTITPSAVTVNWLVTRHA